MIQDEWLSSLRKGPDGGERFLQRFAGDKSSREPVLRAQARDAIRDAFLCGKPEDQISQRVRIGQPFFLEMLL
jgi:hypothetical protein